MMELAVWEILLMVLFCYVVAKLRLFLMNTVLLLLTQKKVK